MKPMTEEVNIVLSGKTEVVTAIKIYQGLSRL